MGEKKNLSNCLLGREECLRHQKKNARRKKISLPARRGDRASPKASPGHLKTARARVGKKGEEGSRREPALDAEGAITPKAVRSLEKESLSEEVKRLSSLRKGNPGGWRRTRKKGGERKGGKTLYYRGRGDPLFSKNP